MYSQYEIRKVGSEQFKAAQGRANAFGEGPTFNFSAAFALANIDAMTNFCVTEPKMLNGESLVRENELLYAVDVHGGPGGFVEYVLIFVIFKSFGPIILYYCSCSNLFFM